jgi:hypothetical protein
MVGAGSAAPVRNYLHQVHTPSSGLKVLIFRINLFFACTDKLLILFSPFMILGDI